MKLPDALRGIVLLGINSAPLIYLVEQHPSYIDRMVFILRYISSGPISAVGSTLILTEVLSHPLRLGNIQLVQDYEDIIKNSIGFELISMDDEIARRAAALRAKYGLKTPDALHIATALETGCHAFLTNDMGLKRVTEIRVPVLDELEVN
ncbi:MAG: PIN domain-containing protein [Chloroflexi bacterium]|nr:PIN domain-containing protein [Chloroflexota bacterium]MCC6892306.1 PIN domain-containing protein [Anaerolineae bacterium]